MEIKKTKHGWEYDGVVFTKKSDAIEAKKATEQNKDLPISLQDQTKKTTMIYDSEKHTSFGFFVASYIQKTKGKKTILALSNEIGVSKQTFFKWINGECLPSHKHVKNIKKVMKCSDEVLFAALITNLQNHMAKILGTGVKRIEKFYEKMAANR